ncbi:MAG: GNAT family N-acetyltransferase [Elusimicrobia bacterium]|nr:GNAT family N-acetyltransferase [Elusimicrobiota bacterium]
MRLEDFSLNDFELVESLLSDPAGMADLGGPLTRDEVAKAMKNFVDAVETEEGWIHKIMPGESSDPAGLVFLWDRPWGDGAISEVSVQILPKYQGRGLAKAAAKAVLARALAEGRCKSVHSFPPAVSARAQALCASLGFRKLERCELPFGGKPVRRVHWRLDL